MTNAKCSFCKGSGRRGFLFIAWDCTHCVGRGFVPKRSLPQHKRRSESDDTLITGVALDLDVHTSPTALHQTTPFVPGGGHFGGGGATGRWQDDVPSHHSTSLGAHVSHDSGNYDSGGGDSGGDSGGGDGGGD